MGPFRLNKPHKDARFLQTHLETGTKPPNPQLHSAALRGKGPARERQPSNPVITEAPEAGHLGWRRGSATNGCDLWGVIPDC